MSEFQLKQYNNNLNPILFVEVNLGENNQKRIVVFEGDKAEDLATQFAIKYSKYLSLYH